MELPPKERGANGHELNPVEPRRVRFMMQDVTNEAVHRILSENPRGLILMYDELAGWVKNFNRYNSGSESEFWMSVFNHKVAMSDRKSSQSGVFIRNPFLCVIGTIQPKVLTDLAANNRNANGFIAVIRHRGCMARDSFPIDWHRTDRRRQWRNHTRGCSFLAGCARPPLSVAERADRPLQCRRERHPYLHRKQTRNLRYQIFSFAGSC